MYLVLSSNHYNFNDVCTSYLTYCGCHLLCEFYDNNSNSWKVSHVLYVDCYLQSNQDNNGFFFFFLKGKIGLKFFI